MPRRPPAVARVLERVTRTAREHEMFEPGDLVLVSCSGGPDSVCLLYSLWHLRRLFKIRLAVFHFDHKLRPESAKDAVYVRRLSERLNLPFHLRVADDEPIKGESVEAWGWAARLRARSEVGRTIHATKVARAHTLDDRAESVVMALIFGAGPYGFLGLRAHAGSDVQPLFDVSREEVETFCRALGLRPRIDPSNLDTSKLRAAIRHKVLPVMEEVARGGAKKAIVRTAEQLRPTIDGMRHAAQAEAGVWHARSDGGFGFAVSRLHEEPYRWMDRNALLMEFRLLGHRVTTADIEAVLDLADGRPGRERDLSGGLKAVREREYVRVSRASPET
jgi:tRNA(Ile)-lysidine synthase